MWGGGEEGLVSECFLARGWPDAERGACAGALPVLVREGVQQGSSPQQACRGLPSWPGPGAGRSWGLAPSPG